MEVPYHISGRPYFVPEMTIDRGKDWDSQSYIELDDGKIYFGNPDQFDGKNPWVSGEDFPNKTNPLIGFIMFYPLVN